MHKSFFTLVFGITVTIASAQNNNTQTSISTEIKETQNQVGKLLYGPLPYRTLKETIGEIYITLPLSKYDEKSGYRELFKKGDKKNVDAVEGAGKKLKLIFVNENEGIFTDSNGVEYICKIFEETFTQLAPLSDIENSRKLLINKPLWLNVNKFVVGDPYSDKGTVIENARFSKVIVIDVLASYSNEMPIFIICKDDKGRVGYENVNMSGTNSTIELSDLFIEKFFTENPQTKYKLSDKTWATVKAGRTEIGMPMDAVQLIEGRPTKRNKSVVGTIRKEQWVYGETAIQSYFYFENGKLTGISR
ncbi:DUF2845 domain-containing protein [Mucilaginibacter sp. UR6-1]|uniref:DUF2845 domain-containing protein n=1 Tax=Mucilaginibacter sp. UR6-1 TaxID=1435643 RepID=UPI001E4F1137|nr:DUF2845 domain-containing protein [Mucilaginibacter sp. UR6-1]MCC8409787.1 DUF2845 domain-containing protein [Mucilaginibacter sp. UR6-1]